MTRSTKVIWRQHGDVDELDLFGTPSLFELYAIWREQAGPDRQAPRWPGIDPGLHARLGLFGQVHVVDCAAENPLGYRFLLFGARVSLDRYADYTGMALGDYKVRTYVEQVAADYCQAKRTAQPVAHALDFTLNRVRCVYNRVVLPFTHEGNVERLVVAIAFDEQWAPK